MRTRYLVIRAHALLVPVVLLSSAGCKCGADKPYTPFTVGDSAAPAPTPSASAAELVEDAARPPAFAGKRAAKAPPGATRWQIDGTTLEAPSGRSFERGLAADFDGDGKLEAVTWTLPAAGAAAAAAGELWLHPAGAPPKKLLALPGFVPSGPGCKLEPTLAQTGPKSVTLDVSATCDAPLLARTPRRAIVVVAPLAERPTVLALRVAEAAPGEKLALALDSTDRDGDGRDDVKLTVSVGKSDSKTTASAALVWFDRAAGVSRDATEPAGSIGRVASLAVSRAKNAKNAESVPALVDATRRLLSTLCAEGGVPRLFDADGGAIACGKLGVVVDRLALGELRAALTRNEPLAAMSVIARDGWYFGRASEKTAKELKQAMEKACERIDVTPLTLEARALPRTDAPRFSPLSFDEAGTLTVQTSGGLVRVAKGGTETLEAEAGAPRALEVRSESGVRVTGIAHACDRNELLLTAEPEPIVTTLLAARPGACRGAGPPKSAPLIALGFKDGAPEALVALAHVGPQTSLAEAVLRPRVLGTPRSPDGRLLVAASPLGLLVTGTKKPELWRSTSMPEWTALSDCVVANDARAVACVGGGRVLLFERP